MKLSLITPPSLNSILSDCRVKEHLRIDEVEEDALLYDYALAAYELAQELTNRQFVQATYKYYLDGFPIVDRFIELPRGWLQSVTSVEYYDEDNVLQPFTDFDVDTYSTPGQITLKPEIYWPDTYDKVNAVEITYVCGKATLAAVPNGIKQGLRLLIGHMYENREGISYYSLKEIPMGIKALLTMHKIHTFDSDVR